MQYDVSLEQLHSFPEKFWGAVGNRKVFAFHGVMGAGKTTIITALCRFKGAASNLSSPTFSIINEYAVPKDDNSATIYHIDLYRLESAQEIMQTGVEECLASGNVCMVEWPEKAPWLFDDEAVQVFIEIMGPTNRRIEVSGIELPDAN